jgi:ABC-type nitrate/sulfonate/bicarbonate transport system substrate-binding protein
MRRGSYRSRALLTALVLAVLATACGDGGGDSGATDGDTGASTTLASDGATSGGQTGPGTPEPRPLDERVDATIVMGAAIEPFAAPLLADHFGEFERENLDVDVQVVPPTDGLVLLSRGEIDMQVVGIGGATLNARANDVDVRFVANTHYQTEDNHEGLWVRSDIFRPDGTPDPERVRGMQVAVGAQGVAAVSTVPLVRWLETMDLSLSDVEPVPLQGADILTALEQGSVGAGYVLTPHWQLLEQDGCCELVTPTPPIAAGAYLFRGQTLDEDREVAAAIMRALMRTERTYLQGDYHADPEVLAALAEVLGQPADSIAAAPPLRFDPDLGFERDVLEEVQQAWLDAGGVLEYSDPLPVDELVDTSIVDELLRE